jgi:NTP pyrophosphatase (non-canonical NTP hydrolase)
MTLSEYQSHAGETAMYAEKIDPLIGEDRRFLYIALCLAGEAGEVANKAKKILRDRGGSLDAEMRDELAGELGDILWYLARFAEEIGVPLEEIASRNLTKLADRKSRAVLQGAGDRR